jgi:hypothetical protein
LLKSKRGGDVTLLQLIETAGNEESELRSHGFRSNQTWSSGPISGQFKTQNEAGLGGTQQRVIKREVMLATKDDRKCFVCDKMGHLARNCRQKLTCDRCGKKGHTSLTCRVKDANNASSGQGPRTGNLGQMRSSNPQHKGTQNNYQGNGV